MRRWSGLLLAIVALQGCYTYVPVETSALTQGTVLRARLSEPASFELRQLTAHYVRRVDGEFIRATPDSLLVSALWLDAEGIEFNGEGWTVRIPARQVQGIEARRLSRWRTMTLLAAGAVATVAGFDALRGGSTQGGGSGSGGQPR